ncbi:MAG: putative lipid II flippase FtsW [Peptococcaceae bacterium]|nr:putative lipid II flippase FtsW [Peptococcaceae bacterium]
MGAKSINSKKYHSPDFPLILVTLALLALGIVMVFSSSVGFLVGNSTSVDKVDIYKFFKAQALWATLGLTLMFFLMNFNHKLLRKMAPTILLIGIVLLVLVYIPALGGSAQRGSARWVNLKVVTIQPSEVIKLALAVFLAAALAERGAKTLRGISLPLVAAGVCAILVVKQPDLGTTMVIACTTLSMIFVAGMPTYYFLPLLGAGGVLVTLVITRTSYMLERINAWLDPWKFANGSGYQTVNALMALGSGGIFGVGLGRGMQKFGHVPENHTDMIFAVIGEELGLIGTTLVLLLFAFFLWRGLNIAFRVKDPFSRYLAVGITSMIGFQAIINLGVVTGLLPVTGVTLPFISYGGSSLTILLAGVGILLNISRYAETTDKPRRDLQAGINN